MAAYRGLSFFGKVQGLLSSCSGVNLLNTCRYASYKAQALVYDEFGDPGKVLRLDFVDRDEIGPESIGVHMIAAPINPADINTIQGSYGIKPKLPAVGGNEGFGRIIKTGKNVQSLKEGDFVIFAQSGLGAWSRYNVLTENELIKIPNNISLELAATLTVNPCTAYRMLKDFEHLKPGSTIIQNGANSGVGRAVIQLAAAWGIQTINIVRDRPNIEDLKRELTDLGATHVLTEEFCRTPEMNQFMKDIPKPQLGFNCIGGKSATELSRRLGHGGTLVTYGGMSKKPFAVPTGQLIFNDIRLRGFWRTGWDRKQNPKSQEMLKMVDDICQLHTDGKFHAQPCTRHKMQDYKIATEAAMQSFSSSKQLFLLSEDIAE